MSDSLLLNFKKPSKCLYDSKITSNCFCAFDNVKMLLSIMNCSNFVAVKELN